MIIATFIWVIWLGFWITRTSNRRGSTFGSTVTPAEKGKKIMGEDSSWVREKIREAVRKSKWIDKKKKGMDRLTNSETSTQQVLSHTLSKVMRGLVLVRKRRTLEGRTTDPKFHQRLTLGVSECRHISRRTVLIPYLAFKSTKWGCSFCWIPITLTSQTLSTDNSQKRKKRKLSLQTDKVGRK